MSAAATSATSATLIPKPGMSPSPPSAVVVAVFVVGSSVLVSVFGVSSVVGGVKSSTVVAVVVESSIGCSVVSDDDVVVVSSLPGLLLLPPGLLGLPPVLPPSSSGVVVAVVVVVFVVVVVPPGSSPPVLTVKSTGLGRFPRYLLAHALIADDERQLFVGLLVVRVGHLEFVIPLAIGHRLFNDLTVVHDLD